jgi:hypothetical protein
MIEVELSGVIVSLYDYFLEKLLCDKQEYDNGVAP